MEKKKAKQTLLVSFILFFIISIVWFSITLVVPKPFHVDGFEYGSEQSPIIMHFQTDSRRDRLEITYTTSSSYVTVYQLDRCNYEAFEAGLPLTNPIILQNDQTQTLTLRADQSNCVDNKDIYIVWDIYQGIGIRVDYECTYKNYGRLLYVLIFFFTGLVGLVILFFGITSIKELKIQFITYLQIKQKDRMIARKKRKNLVICNSCGMDTPFTNEFCVHCGEILTNASTVDDTIQSLMFKQNKMGEGNVI